MKACLLTFGLIIFILGPRYTFASHAMGTDITYQWVSGNTYDFTLSFYRDCAGTTAPSNITLNVNSPSGCGTSSTISLTQSGTGMEVSPLCPAQLSNSTCNSGSLPGVQQYIYSGTHTFSTACSDWNISWTYCCRNNMITNITSPSSNDMYVETTLDNTGTLNNSSPTFTSLPVPYICANQLFCYNHGALDPDGDSLVYRLINALDGPYPGSDITYNAPFSGTYPFGTVSGSVSFDSATGSMCITPDAAQVAVVTILVEEYRNGNLISTTMRDLQIVVQTCSNTQPNQSSGGMINSVGGVVLDSNSVEVCPDDPISFEVVFSDANASDSIFALSNIGSAIPGATFTTSGTNPITTRFSWTPSVADVGFHSFTITIQDNGCPILGNQVYSYDIMVLEGTSAGPDQNYCPAGGPVTLVAGGGTNFTWNVLSGDMGSLTCNPCANQTVSPNLTTTYEVSSNLSGTCKNRDTVTVNWVPDFPLSMTPLNPAICLNEIISLNANAGPAGGPFTYNWSPTIGLTASTLQNPDASPPSTTRYYVDVTSAAGCILQDSITVTVTGIGPTVLPHSSDTDLCAGISTQLNATAFIQPTLTGPNPAGCSGSTSSGIVGSDASSNSYLGPFNGSTTSPYLMRHQYLYTAAELAAAGFTHGGTITQIALDLEFAKALDFDNFTLKMGGTNTPQFLSGTFVPNLDQVYFRGTHTLPNSTGWHSITLDTPYDWDGTTNLIVEFCSEGTQDLDFNEVHYTSTSPDNYAIYDYNATGLGCAEPLGTRTTIRPNMSFTLCAPPVTTPIYSWTPVTGLSDPNISNPVAVPASSTTYQLNVTDGASGCAGSGQITITVGADFSLTTPADTTICYGGTASLFSTPDIGGSFTYHWSPGTGLSNPTLANPTASPSGSVDYTVEVSNGGCIQLDSISVSVSGTPVSALSDQDTVCPGTTVQLNVASFGLLDDDFEPGIDMSMWAILNGASATADCGANSGTHALHFDGTTLTREAVTTPLNTLSCTSLDFCIFLGTGSAPCENVDVGESVYLNYSTDGGVTWTQLGFYDEAVYTSWTCVTVPLPAGAQNLNTQFQWIQPSFSSCIGCDNWAIDDVNLNCSPSGGPFTYNWTPPTGLSDPSIANPTATVDANLHTYSVSVTDLSAPGCPSTANVNVVIDSSVFVEAIASDPTPCSGDNVQLNANITGSALPSTLPSCGINGTSLTQPSVTSQVGGGTLSSSTYSAFTGFYGDAKVQILYTAADLQAAGVPSGTITELNWNVTTKNSNKNYRNFTIGLACTGSSNLTTTAWEPDNTVFGPQNYQTTLGMNTFPITPFDWDGTSNLVVTLCYNNRNNNSPGGYDYGEYTSGIGYTCFTRNYSSSNGANGCSLPPAYSYTSRPNIRFTVVPPPPNAFSYAWTPPSGLSGATLSNPTTTFTSSTVYTVSISGGKCTVSDTVNLVACGTLPVDALELRGNQGHGGMQLRWTANEIQTDHFLVQRSQDGQTFQTLDQVAAAGDPSGRLEYAYEDGSPYHGMNYYRVKWVDREGIGNISNTLAARFDASGNMIKVYPNPIPTHSELHVDYYSNQVGKLKLTLLDLQGRLIKTEGREVKQGMNELDFNFQEVSQGSYFIKIEDGVMYQIHKLMVVQ